MIANGYKVSFWSNENALKLGSGDGCATLNILKCTEFYILFTYFLEWDFFISFGCTKQHCD